MNPKFLAVMWAFTALLVVALVSGNITAAWWISGLMSAFVFYAII